MDLKRIEPLIERIDVTALSFLQETINRLEKDIGKTETKCLEGILSRMKDKVESEILKRKKESLTNG